MDLDFPLGPRLAADLKSPIRIFPAWEPTTSRRLPRPPPPPTRRLTRWPVGPPRIPRRAPRIKCPAPGRTARPCPWVPRWGAETESEEEMGAWSVDTPSRGERRGRGRASGSSAAAVVGATPPDRLITWRRRVRRRVPCPRPRRTPWASAPRSSWANTPQTRTHPARRITTPPATEEEQKAPHLRVSHRRKRRHGSLQGCRRRARSRRVRRPR